MLIERASKKVDKETAAIANALGLELSFGYGRGKRWPVSWHDGACTIYHPPPDGVHDSAELMTTSWGDCDRTCYNREMGMQILCPTWDNHDHFGEVPD